MVNLFVLESVQLGTLPPSTTTQHIRGWISDEKTCQLFRIYKKVSTLFPSSFQALTPLCSIHFVFSSKKFYPVLPKIYSINPESYSSNIAILLFDFLRALQHAGIRCVC